MTSTRLLMRGSSSPLRTRRSSASDDGRVFVGSMPDALVHRPHAAVISADSARRASRAAAARSGSSIASSRSTTSDGLGDEPAGPHDRRKRRVSGQHVHVRNHRAGHDCPAPSPPARARPRASGPASESASCTVTDHGRADARMNRPFGITTRLPATRDRHDRQPVLDGEQEHPALELLHDSRHRPPALPETRSSDAPDARHPLHPLEDAGARIRAVHQHVAAAHAGASR